MAVFQYAARDSSGASLKGEIIAQGKSEASRLLRAEGKFVTSLDESSKPLDIDDEQAMALVGGRVRQEDIIFLFSQLSIMVDTGVSLANAIDAAVTQAPHGRFQSVLKDIQGRVESGEPFSTAMSHHPKVFGDFYVNLLRAAEVSGTMGPMLNRCAEYLTSSRELQKKVKSALTYPLILMIASAGVTIFLITFVLPNFLTIYAGKKATLPLPTVILVTGTDWLMAYWAPVLAGSMIAITSSIWFMKSNSTRTQSHWLRLHVPILGGMLRRSYVTTSLRTLGILVDSGVSMLEAVWITRALSNNYHFATLWAKVAERLQHGEALSKPLEGSDLIPRPVIQMIKAGESSGQLGTVLDRLCDFLDNDLRQSIKTTTQMIEPIMIGIMGAVVGGIAIALLLPIMSISKVIAH